MPDPKYDKIFFLLCPIKSGCSLAVDYVLSWEKQLLTVFELKEDSKVNIFHLKQPGAQ